MSREINVQLSYNQKDLNQVLIKVASADKKKMTAQEILDAVSDVLLVDWEIVEFTPQDLDS